MIVGGYIAELALLAGLEKVILNYVKMELIKKWGNELKMELMRKKESLRAIDFSINE